MIRKTLLTILFALNIAGVILTARQTQEPERPKLRFEIITLTSRGFEPARLNIKQGVVRLAIDNRSGLGEVDYDLVAVQGNQSIARRKSNVWDWREWVRFTPGRYTLRENNSGALMDIIVE